MASTVEKVLELSSKEERERISQGGPIMRAKALKEIIQAIKDSGIDISATDPVALLNAASNFIDNK